MHIIPSCPSAACLRSIGCENPEAFRKAAKEGFHTEPGLHWSHSAAAFLETLNRIGNYSGVESLYPEKPHLFYLNAGDSYTPTVFFNWETDNLFISDFATASGAERR